MLGKKHSIKTKTTMSQNRIGPKNSNWKGGVTATTRGIRRSPKYYQWRKEVLKRDGHVCQKCFSKNKLHVHHINPLSKCPEKIFDIDNGITYCEKCHLKGCHHKEH